MFIEAGAGAQGEVARLRRRLLHGRGPGASERELAPYMHDRAFLGAVPTMVERELVQVQTGRARGDAAAIEDNLGQMRASLAATIDELTEWRRVWLRAAALGAGCTLCLGLLVTAALHRRGARPHKPGS